MTPANCKPFRNTLEPNQMRLITCIYTERMLSDPCDPTKYRLAKLRQITNFFKLNIKIPMLLCLHTYFVNGLQQSVSFVTQGSISQTLSTCREMQPRNYLIPFITYAKILKLLSRNLLVRSSRSQRLLYSITIPIIATILLFLKHPFISTS